MTQREYTNLYGCKCSCSDISECTCSHDISRPDFKECTECPELIVEGEAKHYDSEGNALCEACYYNWLADYIEIDELLTA